VKPQGVKITEFTAGQYKARIMAHVLAYGVCIFVIALLEITAIPLNLEIMLSSVVAMLLNMTT
jgi:hypothetical protein